MNRTEKRLLLRTLELGLILTLAVIAADYLGVLDPFERYLYDQRPPLPIFHPAAH